jgi:hypothetical protein
MGGIVKFKNLVVFTLSLSMTQSACAPAKVEGAFLKDMFKKQVIQKKEVFSMDFLWECLRNRDLMIAFGSVVTVSMILGGLLTDMFFGGRDGGGRSVTPDEIVRIKSDFLNDVNEELKTLNLYVKWVDDPQSQGFKAFARAENPDDSSSFNTVPIKNPSQLATMIAQAYPYVKPQSTADTDGSAS